MPTVLALLVVAITAAQTPSRADILTAARDVIDKAHYCSLVTLGEDGHPQARMVDPLAPDERFTMWIATNPLTRKTKQIQRDGRVTLLCFDAATALLGRAELVNDSASKRTHWKKDWAQIYKDGPDSKDLVLIRVTPSRLEIVSESRGMVGDPKTWLPLAIDFPK
jgi:general stress protein 26